MVSFDQNWFRQLKLEDISTLDGWQEFVADRDNYKPPPRFTHEQRAELPLNERRHYDLARRIANVNLRKHDTPMTQHVRDQIEPILQSNLLCIDPGVRAGTFISADGGLGKSTIIRELAADFDTEVRGLERIAPGLIAHNDRWVPVAWITVPPKLSIRSLAHAILDFFGHPYRESDRDPKLTARVALALRSCGTRLLVLDDITRYKDYEPDRFASDWIRNLMETSVSIVAMGVDVRGSGILYDGKTHREQRLRTQTARRFSVIDMKAFSYDTDDEIRAWVRHLRAVENDLHLLDVEPGMLSEDLADYLFTETDGVIGVLTRWVSIAAMRAVGRPDSRGGERLTKADFERIPVPTVASLKTDLAVPGKNKDAVTGSKAAAKKKPKSRRSGNTMYDQAPRERADAL